MEIKAILKLESDPLHSFYVSVIKGVMMNIKHALNHNLSIVQNTNSMDCIHFNVIFICNIL